MPLPPIRASTAVQLRALTGAFLARFFENESTAAPTDMRQSFFWLVALLATPGIFLPLYMGLRWSNFAAERGVAALRVSILLDKTMYLNLTFVTVGIVSVIVWHALLPDRRDGLVLGGLPVPTKTVYSAKLLALMAYALLLAIGMHTPAAILYGLGFGVPEGSAGVVRNIAAVFVSATAVNLFVIASVAGAQSLCLALGGPRRFARLSPAIQIVLIGAATFLFVRLPAVAGGAPSLAEWPSVTHVQVLSSPPIWFLGMYELVAGHHAPVMTLLADRAVAGLAVAFSLLLLSYPLASHRALAAAVEGADQSRPSWIRAVAARAPQWLSRDSHQRASVQFLLSALARTHQHRLMLSVVAGVGLTAVMPIALGEIARYPSTDRHHDVALLAAPLLLMFALAVGLRIAAALPSELPAAWVFAAAPAPMFAGRDALRRVMFALAVAAPLSLAAPVWTWLFGAGPAIVHLLACTLGGLILIDVLVWGFVGVPCAKPLAPSRASLQSRWPLFAAGLYAFAYLFPSWQIAMLNRLGPLLMLGPLLLVWSFVSRSSASAAHANGVSGDPHNLLSLNLNVVPAAPSVPKERHA